MENAVFDWNPEDVPYHLKYNLTAQNTDLFKRQFLLQSRKLTRAWAGENRKYAQMYPKFHYIDDDQNVTLTMTNRTTDSQILLYSAVPKTGTTLLTAMLKKLGRDYNHFNVTGHRWMPMFEDKYLET